MVEFIKQKCAANAKAKCEHIFYSIKCCETWRIPCILFQFSLIFTYFIKPSKGFSCLCSVNVAETRLDAAEESNWGSRQRGVKRLDALTHTAIAYAATSP
jgi:hypothetical protein